MPGDVVISPGTVAYFFDVEKNPCILKHRPLFIITRIEGKPPEVCGTYSEKTCENLVTYVLLTRHGILYTFKNYIDE